MVQQTLLLPDHGGEILAVDLCRCAAIGTSEWGSTKEPIDLNDRLLILERFGAIDTKYGCRIKLGQGGDTAYPVLGNIAVTGQHDTFEAGHHGLRRQL